MNELVPGVSETIGANGAAKPFFWFMSFASDPSACGASISTGFTVDAKQADGSELSYEEQGLPLTYGIFWAIATAQLAFHVWKHYLSGIVFAPALVRALTATLSLHAASDLLHLIEWAGVAKTGRGSVGLAALAGLLRLGAQATMWASAALSAVGFGISSAESTWRADFKAWVIDNWRGALAFAALVITYLVTAMIYAVAGAAATSRTASPNAWPAVVLIALTISYIAWFIRRSALTQAAEISLAKRSILLKLTWAFAASFLVLPCAEFLSECGFPNLSER
jgi:hypothetical protein